MKKYFVYLYYYSNFPVMTETVCSQNEVPEGIRSPSHNKVSVSWSAVYGLETNFLLVKFLRDIRQNIVWIYRWIVFMVAFSKVLESDLKEGAARQILSVHKWK